jgi:hypothetical protein
MIGSEDKINTSRRNILKKATVAVGTLVTASVVVSNVQATIITSGDKGGAQESNYLPSPKQVPVTEGVLPLSGGAGLYYWDTGGNGPTILLSLPR